MRVLAAVSGGVDSAVAMARAADAGHDVTAVHMALSADPVPGASRGCCTIADAHDARRAADVARVPFYVWDLAEQFRRTVVADFLAEYEAGRTPNPCVRCNEHVKFSALLDRAIALGFDAVVTGHYARLDHTPGGLSLRRARDEAKDQSYVLAVLGDRLSRALFPLGDSTKDEVRAEASDRGLLVADKPDSHDICFIPDGDTSGFLQRRLGRRPGPIVASDGHVVGEHEGTYGFTVGQRRGLRISQPAPSGRPRYVLSVDAVSRTITVGERDALRVRRLSAEGAIWCGPASGPGDRVGVQIRAHSPAVPGVVTDVSGTAFTVVVDEDLLGVAPGQAAVLYDGDRVVGQGTIA